MRTSRLLGAFALLLSFCGQDSERRSVTSLQLVDTPTPPKFSREKATGLFVGVRDFPHDATLTVPYAVDDAVDLAYRFSLDQRVGLIPPRRVVLALSGSPQKEVSKERLTQLKHAGATVWNATAGDILELLKEQSARAGDEGLFVLSIASHGFLEKGDSFILGSASSFGSPETSLRTATIFDVAAHARRSLIFIDACRDRAVQGSRSATPDPAAAAPHIKRMRLAQGQVIFYAAAAGQYAFDDHVRQNGVFTTAVLDGLSCDAAAPRGTVIVETLHTYVDRAVREWIRDNKKRTVNPATQISMEGQTRNMPLSECWRPSGPRIRVSIDRSTVTAYSEDTHPLWRQDFGESFIHAEAADLEADAMFEVVVGLRDRILVIDRDGQTRWSKSGETQTLRTFTTHDLFRKHTNQIVALWNDEHGSRLTIFDSEGNKRWSSFDYAGELRHVTVGRATNRHAPRIVAATRDTLLLLNPKKLDRDPIWQFRSPNPIEGLQILDGNHDSRRDIAVVTTGGKLWFTFDGKVLRR